MDEQIYNKHYIRTDIDSNIIHGFSDAFEQPRGGDILINERGGRHFRLSIDGEDNPDLMGISCTFLYQYIGGIIVAISRAVNTEHKNFQY